MNPLTGAETTINLNLAPRSLSVSPDGTHTAVGHDGWISYVNLTAGYVEKNLAVSVTANSLVLAANGNILVSPSTTVNVATGAQTTPGYVYWQAVRPALHPERHLDLLHPRRLARRCPQRRYIHRDISIPLRVEIPW